MDKNKSLTEIFNTYISPLIPQKVTNVLWNIFKAMDVAFGYLESYLKVSKREQNILTAQEVSSLRHISAQNGFEPQLKIPSNGKLLFQPNGSLFNKNGITVYLPPYAKIVEENTGLEYFVDNNNITKLTNQPTLIMVKQGIIESKLFNVETTELLQKFYINSSDVADKSITIFDAETKEEYMFVESFYDNVNLNNNKQFIIKFSTQPKAPIVVYIKGTKINQTLNISYILTQGSNGNIMGESNFICNQIIDYKGDDISYSDEDLIITNYEGFTLGSDGSDINTIKSAIGYNHGISLLFDRDSYSNFLHKFSTILIQNVYVDDSDKAIKHLFIGNKNIIIGNSEQTKTLYNEVINNRGYQLTNIEKNNLENIISDNEFTLSSSVIHELNVTKYSLQIMFNDITDMYKYGSELDLKIYNEFAKFLYLEKHIFNFDDFINDFCEEKNIIIKYIIFNDKLNNQYDEIIIDSTNELPILKGDFNLYDINNVAFRLNDNITYITK